MRLPPETAGRVCRALLARAGLPELWDDGPTAEMARYCDMNRTPHSGDLLTASGQGCTATQSGLVRTADLVARFALVSHDLKPGFCRRQFDLELLEGDDLASVEQLIDGIEAEDVEPWLEEEARE